jgi:hypothetical protein
MLSPRRIQSRGFNQKPPERVRLRDMPPGTIAKARPLVRGTYSSGEGCGPVQKEQIVRSEEYRRLVAALPCSYCRIEGYSQAAHPPPTAKGRKETDLDCFPLCCVRNGVEGCHVLFDTYRLIPAPSMRHQAELWAIHTRAEVKRAGLFPKNLEQT